ncbi:ribokinase [Actinocatenispora thailandica]|uniref:Ribokinase n=1 Tax=Actinocatenispora thailandica TaxID=227318 RepID=A0A7R7DMX7_9ACTN|nr:carbohydrate kinase family protein [Actinocatenispora thailandica]BCJ34542.1 ribokinase [Actinocatenispora thailandica]
MTIFVAGPVSWNRLVQLAELPAPRPHMVVARGWHDTLGGTSAGKALNLRRLGHDVTLATVIGTDPAGGRVRSALTGAGVRLLAADTDVPTEQHLNLMDARGARVSVYLETGPADAELPVEPVTAAMATASAVVLDLATHSRALIPAARSTGVPIWTDLHDYDGRSEFHEPFRDAADHVFLSSDRMPGYRDFLAEQVARGARLAVCTHGADGATALDARGRWYEVAAEPVPEVVDSNGAGDAFFAGFLTRYLADGDVAHALRAGARQGARAVLSPELAPLPDA